MGFEPQPPPFSSIEKTEETSHKSNRRGGGLNPKPPSPNYGKKPPKPKNNKNLI
jgi:hypothetical protein